MGDERTSITTEFEDLLRGLEQALSAAGAAASTARVKLTDIAALESRTRELDTRLTELETAGLRARDSLNVSMPATQATFPQLHAVPTDGEEEEEDEEQDEELALEEEQAPVTDLVLETSVEPSEPAEDGSSARCIRLEVDKKIGSLDLKQVDAAVSEVPVIVDVALLDYDGRHATLKLWLGETDDPDEISTTLLKELRSRLGGEAIAEIQVAFEDAA